MDGNVDGLRGAVRDWLAEQAPTGWRERMRGATVEEWKAFNLTCAAKLRAAGLLAPHWPKEHGGGGFSFTEQLVIQEELTSADFPRPRFLGIALQHAAATLMLHGTPAQQQRLPGILEGEIWCQGFSEPDAGSDLASLRTSAVRDGDRYVVNGQKTWSSVADHASWCLLLARTDPRAPRHAGISLFLLDMASPGVEVRPIRQATGTWEFCEIFLSDVSIPVECRVGAEGDGWRIAQTTLSTERASQVLELHAELVGAIDRIARAILARPVGGGRLPGEDGGVRHELARRAAEVDVLGLLAERLVGRVLRHGDIGPDGSIVKLFYSETLQRLTALAARVQGPLAQVDPLKEVDIGWTSGDWLVDHLKSWTWTIAAGSNEIQRNVIGERVLGLPKEPSLA